MVGRRNAGLIAIKHKGKIFTTSVGSKEYEESYCGLDVPDRFPHIDGSVPPGYAHRPDLISDVFTNSPQNWWKICEINSIFDNYEQLNIADRIFLPGNK